MVYVLPHKLCNGGTIHNTELLGAKQGMQLWHTVLDCICEKSNKTGMLSVKFLFYYPVQFVAYMLHNVWKCNIIHVY